MKLSLLFTVASVLALPADKSHEEHVAELAAVKSAFFATAGVPELVVPTVSPEEAKQIFEAQHVKVSFNDAKKANDLFVKFGELQNLEA